MVENQTCGNWKSISPDIIEARKHAITMSIKNDEDMTPTFETNVLSRCRKTTKK